VPDSGFVESNPKSSHQHTIRPTAPPTILDGNGKQAVGSDGKRIQPNSIGDRSTGYRKPVRDHVDNGHDAATTRFVADTGDLLWFGGNKPLPRNEGLTMDNGLAKAVLRGLAMVGIVVPTALVLGACGSPTDTRAALASVSECIRAIGGVTDVASRLHSDGSPDLWVVDLYLSVDDSRASAPDNAVKAALECGWRIDKLEPNAVSLRMYGGPLPTELALDRPKYEVDLTPVPDRLGLEGAFDFDFGLIVPKKSLAALYGPRG